MVTHEIVNAVDGSAPASLSPKLVTGILRDEMGFQGVIMTDSLTMGGITDRYTEDQATVLAVQAGADLLMGAINSQTAGAMIAALKSAVQSGQISQQRIDDSVRRVLLLKYEMGLLTIPNQ
jgi:beta-N-acetylhexosaminidase